MSGPVIRLKAVEYSGSGPWLDGTANNYNATLQSGVIAKNQFGNGIIFNGSTSWTFPNVGVGSAWTMSVWWKNTGPQVPYNSAIIAQLTGGSGWVGGIGNGDQFSATARRVSGFYGPWYRGTTIQLIDNVWTHITVTWDGTDMKTYVNSGFMGSLQPGGSTSNNGNAYILGGRWDGNPFYMTGELGEVRMYNYAITRAQVCTDYEESAPTFVWQPTQITGCQLWFDGQDQTKMTFNTATTITQWNDKSGSSRNTTALTGTATITDSSGITFDGSSYFTIPNSSIPYDDSSYSIYVVSSLGSSGVYTLLYGGSLSIQTSSTNFVTQWSGPNNLTSTASFTVNTTSLYESLYTSGGTRTTFFNGITDATDTPGSRTQANTPNYIGYSEAGTMSGIISEIIVYNTSHTKSQRQVVEGYLAWKWGFQLPSTHLFYSSPPNAGQPTSGIMILLRAINYLGAGTWFDESGSGLNATLKDGTIQRNSIGNGIILDGATSWTIPNTYLGNAWTINVWYKNTAARTGPACILAQSNNAFIANVALGDISGNGTYQVGFLNTTWRKSGTLSVTNGNWTNIQATWNGTDLKTYINSTLIATTQPGGTAADNYYPYHIGRSWIYPNFMVGEIGEIRMYSYDRTGAQVITDYNASLATFITSPPTTPIISPPRIFIRPRATTTTVELWWRIPAETEGYSISSYTISCINQTFTPVSLAYPATNYTISGLTIMKSYTFQIVAINTNGDTSVPAVFRTVTLDTRPINATSASASVMNSNGTAIISWTPAANPSRLGFAINFSPKRYGTPVALSAVTTANSVYASGLTSSDFYTCTVSTVNDAGWSPYTSTSLIVSATAPQVPMIGLNTDNTALSFYTGSPTAPSTILLIDSGSSSIAMRSALAIGNSGNIYGSCVGRGTIYGADASGNLLPSWSSGDNGYTGTPVISSTGTVFCCFGAAAYGSAANGIAALTSTGTVAQSYTNAGLVIRSNPAIDNDIIYILSSGNKVYSFPVANLTSPTSFTFSDLSTNTTYLAGSTGLAYRNGICCVTGYDLSTGNVALGIRISSTNTYYVSNEANDTFGLYTQPIIQSDNNIVVWMGYHLYKINTSAAKVWQYPSGSSTHTCGSIAQGLNNVTYASIFIVNHSTNARSDYSIVAINSNGTLLWQVTAYPAADNLTVGADGLLYFSYVNSGNYVGALTLAGSLAWSISSSIGTFWPGPFTLDKNGAIYTTDSNSLNGSVYKLVSANSLFGVVGGSGTNTLAYSYNGVDWLGAGNGIFSTSCRAVAKNGIWVAGGAGTNTLAYSYNGVNWVGGGTAIFSTACNAVASNGTRWIAGGTGTNQLAYSSNGIDWFADTSGNGVFTTECKTVVWNGSIWVIGGSGTNQLAYSSDGINWIPELSGNDIFTTRCNALAWNGMWVAGGSGTNTLAYSPDGINWTGAGTSIFSTECLTLAWNGTMWVAGGAGTNTLAYSYNGIDWGANGSSIFSTSCNALTWKGGLWIAGGAGTNRLAYSSDGLNWTASTSGNSILTTSVLALPLPVITITNKGCVAGGVSNTINLAYSSDGIKWIADASGSTLIGNCYAVAYDGKIWVAGGDGAKIAYSYDKINWVAANSIGFIGQPIRAIATNGTLWIACGLGTGAYSYDGINWLILQNLINVTEGSNISCIAWSGSMWIVGGNTQIPTGILAYSYNGLNWILNYNVPGGIGRYVFTIATNGSFWATAGRKNRYIGFYVDDGPGMSYSYDGIEWADSPNGATLCACTIIATNGSMWVGGGSGDNKLIYSYDGITWIASANGNSMFSTSCNGLTWNGSIWIAVGSGTNRVANSLDGINWYFSISINTIMNNSVGVVSAQRALPNVPATTNIFISAGTGTNALIFSYDGLSWYPSDGNSVFTTGYTVAFSGSLWVAGGAGSNRLVYSSNGYNWVASPNGNSIFSTSCNSLAWNGLWVAGGEGTNTLAYSKDGYYWIANGTSIFSTQCSAVAWNGVRWVAGGTGTNQLAYSTNGINWTTSTSGNSILTTSCKAVAWNGVRWVAGGSGTNTLAYSSDGINWTGVGTAIFSTRCNAVAWNGSMWVAGGEGTNTLAYSSDGINWTGIGTAIFSTRCNAVAWNGSRWVAGGSGTNQIAYSTDEIHWVTSLSGNSKITTQTFGVATTYGVTTPLINTNTIVIAAGQGAGSSSLSYSYDGINWLGSISGNMLYQTSVTSIAYNGTVWLACGGTILAYSYDGINWVNTGTTLITTGYNAIAASRTMSIAGGSGTNKMIFSFDGISWSASTSGNSVFAAGYPSCIATNGSMWVAGGFNGTATLAYSYDGINWTNTGATGLFEGTVTTVATNGTIWLAGGGGGTNKMAYSYNGINWTGLGNIFETRCYDVEWNGSMWVAVGGDYSNNINCIQRSSDGINWSPATSVIGTIPYRLQAVTWNGVYWVIGGVFSTSVILYSTDGLNWIPAYSANILLPPVCGALASKYRNF